MRLPVLAQQIEDFLAAKNHGESHPQKTSKLEYKQVTKIKKWFHGCFMAKMIKKRLFPKLLGRPLLLPYTNCHELPKEIQLLKSIVSRSRAVEVLNPTCQSSLALQLLPCWLPSPPTSICPEKKQEFVSLKNSLKARWCHWENAHVIWCHLRIPLAWIRFKNLIVVDSDSRDKYTVFVQSPAS